MRVRLDGLAVEVVNFEVEEGDWETKRVELRFLRSNTGTDRPT